LLNDYLAQLRTDLGKQQGWTNEEIAVSKGISVRQEYNQQQEYSGLEGKMEQFLGDGRDPLDRILDLTRPDQAVTTPDIMTALRGFSPVQVQVIITRGVKSGVLRSSGLHQYEATGKQLVYPAAKTPAERAARSMRATLVARDCQEGDVYFTTGRSLTNEGVRRVHQFLDPTTGEAITLRKLEECEGATNFGVLLAFTQHRPDDKQKRDVLWRAINRHDDPENCVLRTTGFLDKKAVAAFAKKDAPEIRQQVEAVLEEAAALGDGQRRDFVLSFAFTPLAGVKGD
jgi:hypothetical protein